MKEKIGRRIWKKWGSEKEVVSSSEETWRRQAVGSVVGDHATQPHHVRGPRVRPPQGDDRGSAHGPRLAGVIKSCKFVVPDERAHGGARGRVKDGMSMGVD
jgi:hypothetical protein